MGDIVRDWQERDARAVWHPYTQHYSWLGDDPLVIERGDGVWLTDVAGNRYLDAGASLWVTAYRHNEPRLADAIGRQLGRLDHSTFFGATHTPGVRLAERLVELAPVDPDDWRRLTKAFFGSDGSSMVDAALKLAYQFCAQTGDRRDVILHLEGSFHGDSIGGISLAGGSLMRRTYGSLVLETGSTPSPAPAPGEDPEQACRVAVAALEERLAAIGDKVCALIVEPMIQAAGGMHPYHPDYLRACRRLADQYGFLFIVDEVACGVARTGRMWATEHASVVPDVLLCGKGLSGGVLPISALLTTDQIASAFLGFELGRTFQHGHTYAANPLACAAALENLAMVSELDFPMLARSKGELLGELLSKVSEHHAVREVRRLGTMVGVEVVANRPRAGFSVCAAAQRRGVWMRPLGNVVVLMPPLAIDEDELRLAAEALDGALDEVFGAGRR